MERKPQKELRPDPRNAGIRRTCIPLRGQRARPIKENVKDVAELNIGLKA